MDLRHPGDLAGTPALLSTGDPDPHVPWSRVQASADQLTAMGAIVETRRHAGRPHTILPSEIATAREMLFRLLLVLLLLLLLLLIMLLIYANVIANDAIEVYVVVVVDGDV